VPPPVPGGRPRPPGARPPGKAPAPKPKGAFPGAPPAKKAPAPQPPFGKRLHWKLLPAASLEDTIFTELKPWGDVAPPLDTRQLERLFAPAPRAVPPREIRNSALSGAPSAPASGGAGYAGTGGQRDSQGHICLLDPKRAQNLSIGLRQVTLPTCELCDNLRWMRLNAAALTADMLEHLYENLLPTLLEVPELASYSGPLSALRDMPERRLVPLAQLPRLKARVRTMLFSKNMPSVHVRLLARIRSLRDACIHVRDSASLRKVLGTVLRVGNYLNHGVDAPDAGGGVEVRGFAIESLLKLREFRAAQGGEISALHCVVLHLLNGGSQEPDRSATLLQQLRAELRSALEPPSDAFGIGVAGEGIADLRDAVGCFRVEVDLVQSEIERFAECYRLEGESADREGSSAGPLVVLQRLVEDASEIARGLEVELGEALAAAWRLLGFFGERRGELPQGSWSEEAFEAVERFFTIIREFISSLEDCWREVVEQPRRLRIDSGVEVAPPVPKTQPAETSGGVDASVPPGAKSASRLPGPHRSSLPFVLPPDFGAAGQRRSTVEPE